MGEHGRTTTFVIARVAGHRANGQSSLPVAPRLAADLLVAAVNLPHAPISMQPGPARQAAPRRVGRVSVTRSDGEPRSGDVAKWFDMRITVDQSDPRLAYTPTSPGAPGPRGRPR